MCNSSGLQSVALCIGIEVLILIGIPSLMSTF